MFVETEGIVLKQIKTAGGRRIVVLLSRRFGKISAGTSLSESGRSKSALATRPFTYGRYELNKTRGVYHINAAETIKSYYRIGGDVEKYVNCAYALEFTEKLLPEEAPAPGLLTLLAEYFEMMERRAKRFDSLTFAFLFKAMQAWGAAPETERCPLCGKPVGKTEYISIREGGLLCESCARENITRPDNDTLLYRVNFGIVNIMRYFKEHSLGDFEKLALDESAVSLLRRITKDHASVHLDMGRLKSEAFFETRIDVGGVV